MKMYLTIAGLLSNGNPRSGFDDSNLFKAKNNILWALNID